MTRKRDDSGKFLKEEENWVQCALCGKAKKVVKSTLKASKTGKFFCNSECHDTYRIGKEGHKLTENEKLAGKRRMQRLWEDEKWRETQKKKIKKAMQKEETKNLLKEKNSRKRSPRSLEAKKKQSDKLVGKRPKNLNMFQSSSCVRSIHGEITFDKHRSFRMRSTWERNVARYFEFLMKQKEITGWEYEPQRFFFENIHFGNRTYLPDFRITDNDGYQYYVEVKGWMDNNSKVKLKRMKKFFPEIEVQIIDKERYYEVAKIGMILEGWEWDQVSIRARNNVKTRKDL